MGFPLLLNKALKWGQETWIWAFYKLHSFEEGMFIVGKWPFPCCSTKHWPESRSVDWTIVQGKLCKRGECSEWASGLSLAAEQSIGWSQKARSGRLDKVDFVRACSKWASGLSLAAEQSIG